MASGNYNEMVDAQDLIDKVREEEKISAVLGLNKVGLAKEKIAEALGITIEKVVQIIKNQAR